MIKAEIVGDSLSPQGERLTSLLITFPRIILSEINTHRMLSKNTSSSRAIPFNKMVEAIQENPFIPIAWQKHHSGMQGTEYFGNEKFNDNLPKDWHKIEDYFDWNEEEIKKVTYEEVLKDEWLLYVQDYIEQAKRLHSLGVTKQLCNRLLEPFMWTTMLITGSKEGWDNFFELRCPQYSFDNVKFYKSRKEAALDVWGKEQPDNPEDNIDSLGWFRLNKGQAEIHIMDLAEKIYDAMNESTPRQLKPIEWHIPFRDKIDKMGIKPLIKTVNIHSEEFKKHIPTYVKVSTAMAARTSYTVVGDEKEINYERMVELHDRLIAQDPPHSSPMEHCARAMSDQEFISCFRGELPPENKELTYSGRHGWCRNFKGFIPYRHIIESK